MGWVWIKISWIRTKQIFNTSKSEIIKKNSSDDFPFKTKLLTCVHANSKKKSKANVVRKMQSSNNKQCKSLIRVRLIVIKVHKKVLTFHILFCEHFLLNKTYIYF